ncbi:CRISPR-associated helicase Cas3' [Geobacter sp. FeAm09]|uniref:CRISPR-associated helicase Cas3' n=1 Tax=Geobacter sp. FeAm09 TaxID=2597769 RepID=UPI0011EFFADB|nr:CRISPR-associated helicase Cas3' [Geobacter sp. FeAm09]QEM67683.1 CRISPR-associated helicase Cas3' [Geobacter sp. FeAm09]
MREKATPEFIARYRQSDGTPQSLEEHLEGVAKLAKRFAAKIGLPTFGKLLGSSHDLGKYSKVFQDYLKSSEGRLEPDDDDYVDPHRSKGKIDHSSAGAQFVWQHKKGSNFHHHLAANIVALCIASHHSGVIDCLAPNGVDVFSRRMGKPDEKTHYTEALDSLNEALKNRSIELLTLPELEYELRQRLEGLKDVFTSPVTSLFALGFLVRFLFSTLIDADRLNSAERMPLPEVEWQTLISFLEQHLTKLGGVHAIDAIRAQISLACLQSAEREKGLYRLTVPTGGGKTLASLRFALHHAAKHGMDRIIYVVPFTSIIDQNARVARSVFAPLENEDKRVVLEHHSNLTPEQDTSTSKLLSENWDAPIVYTTAVQFLETLFAGGTRGVRRLHQLANAVIIFDEIQTIPIRTVHLFNNAVNFLVSQCGSTVLFCTATQPLLDRVDVNNGAAKLSNASEMMGENLNDLFRNLRRARIEDHCKDGGWTADEVATAALGELADSGSVLIIVNKKSQAKELFERLHGETEHVYHLSTSMCPAHRMTVLDEIRTCLDPNRQQPVICVSTQLIEAGVDVDFGSVIRYLAGLDSIAQAAGRCNRNGRRAIGRVLVVNPAHENLDRLPDIRIAQGVTRRVLHEFKGDPETFGGDLQSPQVMERYFSYYFFSRSQEMTFPVSNKDIDGMVVKSDLLTLLSTNNDAVEIYKNEQRQAPPTLLRQAFMSAAAAFKVIDSPTEGVIVPYGDGERLITALVSCGGEDRLSLMKKAQRYSVNLFPYEAEELKRKRRLYEVWPDSKICYLDERNYSEEFGASLEEVSEMKLLLVSGGDNEEPY